MESGLARTLELMTSRLLLAELHAHTTWSDGMLSLPELVDLYGTHGFDVLSVTDHTLPSDRGTRSCVGMHNWRAYLDELASEAERAQREYGLVLVPGLELTDDHPDPLRSAHALAIGLQTFVTIELGIRYALEEARKAGAALVAAHPHRPEDAGRRTCRFWHERESLARFVDRFELVNRRDVYPWVAEARLPAVATGDFHRPEHLNSWKTLLPCAKDAAAIVDCLRDGRRLYLAPFPLGARPLEIPLAA
jgi:hypothetical protein